MSAIGTSLAATTNGSQKRRDRTATNPANPSRPLAMGRKSAVIS